MAERFVDTHQAKICSSVYHTRSDFFLETYVDRSRPELDLDDLMRVIEAEGLAAEFSHRQILRNQCTGTMGLHMLPEGIPFLTLLAEGSVDLLICDNYMDAAAELRIGTTAGKRIEFFSTIQVGPGIAKSPKLAPAISAANFERLASIFSKALPHTFIVLLGFPWSTYPEKSGRKEWAEEFDRRIAGVRYVPPLIVPEKYKTHEYAHYQPDFYLIYVGMIMAMNAMAHETTKLSASV